MRLHRTPTGKGSPALLESATIVTVPSGLDSDPGARDRREAGARLPRSPPRTAPPAAPRGRRASRPAVAPPLECQRQTFALGRPALTDVAYDRDHQLIAVGSHRAQTDLDRKLAAVPTTTVQLEPGPHLARPRIGSISCPVGEMPGPEAVRNKELDLAVDQLARLVAEQLLGAAVDETDLALRARPARPRPVPTPAAPGNASPRFAARSRPLAHFSLTTPVTVTDGAQPGLSRPRRAPDISPPGGADGNRRGVSLAGYPLLVDSSI